MYATIYAFSRTNSLLNVRIGHRTDTTWKRFLSQYGGGRCTLLV